MATVKDDLKKKKVIPPQVQQQKQFVIDRTSALTEETFKKLCNVKKKSQVLAARLKKKHLVAYLNRRYKCQFAKQIVQYFDFSNNLDYDSFIEEVEQLINFKTDQLF